MEKLFSTVKLKLPHLKPSVDIVVLSGLCLMLELFSGSSKYL